MGGHGTRIDEGPGFMTGLYTYAEQRGQGAEHGLGFGFMMEGAKMMAQNWWTSGAALLATSLLLTNRIFPAMFLLLLFGAGYGILSDPSLLGALGEVRVEFRMPSFALGALTLNDFLLGVVFLALPQIPLTLVTRSSPSPKKTTGYFRIAHSTKAGSRPRPAA